ncbi:hypothetical protein MASR1M50_23290 [Burkholderiales bacterium]
MKFRHCEAPPAPWQSSSGASPTIAAPLVTAPLDRHGLRPRDDGAWAAPRTGCTPPSLRGATGAVAIQQRRIPRHSGACGPAPSWIATPRTPPWQGVGAATRFVIKIRPQRLSVKRQQLSIE